MRLFILCSLVIVGQFFTSVVVWANQNNNCLKWAYGIQRHAPQLDERTRSWIGVLQYSYQLTVLAEEDDQYSDSRSAFEAFTGNLAIKSVQKRKSKKSFFKAFAKKNSDLSGSEGTLDRREVAKILNWASDHGILCPANNGYSRAFYSQDDVINDFASFANLYYREQNKQNLLSEAVQALAPKDAKEEAQQLDQALEDSVAVEPTINIDNAQASFNEEGVFQDCVSEPSESNDLDSLSFSKSIEDEKSDDDEESKEDILDFFAGII